MSKSVVTSRRSFIKGAVAGAVSAGVAPVMAAPAPQNGLPAKWDGEADVVINVLSRSLPFSVTESIVRQAARI